MYKLQLLLCLTFNLNIMNPINLVIPEGNFIFRNKPNSKGERKLYLRYYISGIPVMSSTKIAVKPSDWNARKQKIKAKYLLADKYNSILNLLKIQTDKQMQSYNKPLTTEVVALMMSGKFMASKPERKNEKRQDFIQYALDYNQQNYNLEKIAYSTYSNDSYCIIMFRTYYSRLTGEGILPMDEITMEIFRQYKEYCLMTGNKKQSINKKLKPLFKAFSHAAKSDLISAKLAATITYEGYFDLKKRKYESEVENGEINYLTIEQLSEFYNLYNKVKHDRTREFIDMFMFSFYSCGLRFSDLLTLEWNHIDWIKKEIHKNLFKSKAPHNIPLTDAGMEILENWRQKGYNSRFVFNLLSENFDLDNPAMLDMLRKSKNRSLQTSLNELGRKMSTALPFNLSIHCARHTFAVKALNDGVSLHILSTLLGHGSIVTTEKVYAKYLPSTITEEVRAKMNYKIGLSV